MPESLLNYMFRGTTMSYSELLVSLENIIIDKVQSRQPEAGKITQAPRKKMVRMRAKRETKGS